MAFFVMPSSRMLRVNETIYVEGNKKKKNNLGRYPTRYVNVNIPRKL